MKNKDLKKQLEKQKEINNIVVAENYELNNSLNQERTINKRLMANIVMLEAVIEEQDIKITKRNGVIEYLKGIMKL